MADKQTERRQAEAIVSSEDRLPPGQSLTQKFPVLHYGPTANVDVETWKLRIFGEVEAEQTFTWAEFQKLPRVSITLDIHCVTRWSKFDTQWDGVSVKRLLDEGIIRLKPSAAFVLQHCEHGYTTNIPLDLILSDNVLLATHFNGRPLTPEHGYPLRVVVGSFADRSEQKNAYLWKGGKWLRALEFLSEDKFGFWERYGYHNEADPFKEQRFSND